MNNAGVGIGGAIADAETKKLDMQIDVNLRAVYLVTRESIPMLKAAGADGGALIVNTASIAGKRPQGWLAAYSATKAAVIALTEATAKELAADGVRCTAICPGFVDTAMTEWIREPGAPVGDDPARGRRRGGAVPAAALAGVHRARGDDGAPAGAGDRAASPVGGRGAGPAGAHGPSLTRCQRPATLRRQGSAIPVPVSHDSAARVRTYLHARCDPSGHGTTPMSHPTPDEPPRAAAARPMPTACTS